MSIQFFPLGIPLSSSYALRATTTLATSAFPVTASFSEYIINFVGPTGSVFTTVNAARIV